jgi:thiosulfate dehydrogenase (quinone) large subunit
MSYRGFVLADTRGQEPKVNIQYPVSRGHEIKDPTIVKFLFSDRRAAVLWLILRVWLGLQWVDAAMHKVGDPKWVETGVALKGYWANAVKIPEAGRPPITFDWYRDFINFLLVNETYTWFGKVVAYGELLVGVALIIGAFVGIAAFFGAFMNWNFVMAGTASSNGLLLVLAVALILAWKVAGYLGADFFLLRWIGVPWKPAAAQDKAVTPSGSGGLAGSAR